MINKVVLIGHLGKDPEQKSLPSGATYIRFSVATNEAYKDKEGNWQDSTEWHNVIMWRDMAERAMKQLKKGSLVYIEGKLTHRSWQDADGNTKNMTEVAANLYRSLDKKPSSGGYNSDLPAPEEPAKTGSGTPKAEGGSNEGGENEDDLPF